MSYYCRTRRAHPCRLCGQTIMAGQMTKRVGSKHAHPECFAQTANWTPRDWLRCWPGIIQRPVFEVPEL